MRRVYCYMRVSTDRQAQDGYSLEAQDRVLRDYAAGHGLEIADTFVETESAFTFGKRPRFARMVAAFESSDVRAVLCYKLDRLVRNMTDYALLVEGLGVVIIAMTEGEVSDAANQLTGGIHAVMARYYSQQLSERVALGMATKASRGLWPTGAPTGYRNVGPGIEPEPVSAALVTRLYERYRDGASLTDLAEWAYRASLRTRKGTRLARASIHRILTNPLYRGVINWKGKTYQGSHTPLVSPELWQACQNRLHGKGHSREQTHRFPYRGLLTCGRCGCQLTASLIKGRYVYYHCTKKRGPCDQPMIRAEAMGGLLAPVVTAVHVPIDIYESLVREYEAQAVDRERERKTRLIQAKASLHRASELRTKAYTDKLEGLIDDARWGEVDRSFASEEEEARREVERLSRRAEAGIEHAARVFKLLDRLPELYRGETDDEKAALLRALGSNYIINGQNVVALYRPPFDRVAEGVRCSDWRSRRDSNPCPRDESPIS